VPAAFVGLGAAALLFVILLLAQPHLRSWFERPLPPRAPPERAPEVDLWVGDLAPGVKGVLSAVWNDPRTDERNDELWNERLGLSEPRRLAYYQLHVFNTSSEAVIVTLRDGALTITPKGGAPLPMRSLASLLATASASSPAVAASLAALGSSRETIEVPPGRLAAPFVAFERRVPLDEAVAVARLDGTAFHKRRIPRRRWESLRSAPEARELEDL
jgi:hypothetical protein